MGGMRLSECHEGMSKEKDREIKKMEEDFEFLQKG